MNDTLQQARAKLRRHLKRLSMSDQDVAAQLAIIGYPEPRVRSIGFDVLCIRS